ncbi:MAG: SPOR domain-containing protein [Chlorobium sp.]|nr:SPOR domain-containing protein [Chlorobium sp.]
MAEVLETDASGASHFLKGFAGAMSRELLLHRRLSVKGLGLFTSAYAPPERNRSEEGWYYTPPAQSVIWKARSGDDDTLRLALEGMRLEVGEGARVAGALNQIFSRARKKRLELHLAGFGTFRPVGKGYGFMADEGLLSILNSDYEGLSRVASAPLGSSPILKIVSASAVIVILSAIALTFIFRSSTPVPVPELPPAPPIPVAVDSLVAPVPALPDPADPVFLEVGEFTVVLATYTSEMKARREVGRLNSAGVQAALWPAYSNGVKYWRIRTGQFASRSGAQLAIRALGENVVPVPYIQEVKKRVLKNGKKSM